ncbi:MAG: hypothetical protein ABIB12_02440, partial [Patescibacteria group bacterium]
MIPKLILIPALLLLVLGAGFLLLAFSSSPTQAAVPSWDNLTSIFYDPAQEDPSNTYLQQAAT